MEQDSLPTENWREKYYTTVDSLESTKKEFHTTVAQLTRDLAKISFAGNGVDPNLDEYLRLLRRDISQGAALKQIHQRVESVSHLLKQLNDTAEQKQNELFAAIQMLYTPFGEKKYSRETQKAIKLFKKRSEKCTSEQEALQLLNTFTTLLEKIITEYQQRLTTEKQISWWQKLSMLFASNKQKENNKKQTSAEAKEIKSPSDNLSTFEQISGVENLVEIKSELTDEQLEADETVNTTNLSEILANDDRQILTDKSIAQTEDSIVILENNLTEQLDEKTATKGSKKAANLYIPYSVNHALLRLLEALDFPETLNERAQTLRSTLATHLTLDTLLLAVEAMVSLLLGRVTQEQQNFETFLESINGRLDEVHHFLEQVEHEENDKQVSTVEFDQQMREQVGKIKESFAQEKDLSVLQNKVEERLNLILEKMDYYRKNEAQRVQQALRKIKAMDARLIATEASAKALKHALGQQKNLASQDALTGLKNRAAYDTEIIKAFTHWQQTAEPITLILADLDHFKKINDSYGHTAGDQVLRIVGTLLHKNTKRSDFAARYGGEEFIILCYNTDQDAACMLAEKLRTMISNWKFTYNGAAVQLTMSFGIAELVQGDTPVSLFKRADALLYRAKSAGRNCVVAGEQVKKQKSNT